ncbi:MAG: CoA transferase [Chloroflexota bacterium]
MLNRPTGVLEGIRIIDAGQWLAGTGAGAMLGCLGAETIKIEDPVRGDSYRGMAAQYGERVSVKGRHIGFETANLNKKSITLDLNRDEGRQILYELVAKSDIFHTNATTRTRKKLGMVYDILKRHNPRLIYAVTTTYGSKGTLSDQRGFDTIAQAHSGIMWTTGDSDYDEPMMISGALFDQGTAGIVAFAMVCALQARDRLGIGQEIHVSLLGTAFFLNAWNVNMTLLRGRPMGRYRRRTAPNPIANNYCCADGKWLMLAEPQSQRFWAEACQLLGLSNSVDDPRFATAADRSKNCTELIGILAGTLATRARDEWVGIFRAGGARFSFAPIFDTIEAVQDPQPLANDYVVDFDHPAMGKVKLAGFPVSFSETPAYIRQEAPEHGQHTEEVLTGVLGYDWDRISKLRTEGII